MAKKKISWFITFNDNYKSVYELVKGAVLSSLPFAMDRYCVCDTENEEIVGFLRAHGVRVIPTRLSFAGALERPPLWSPDEKSIWRGAGLRLDIPLLIGQLSLPVEEYYLYTDTDVLFLSDPAAALHKLTPAYFAASGEFTQDPNPPYFNSGVLWANRLKMQETYPDLIQFLISHQCRVPTQAGAFDQGLLNEFYRGKTDYLPCVFNWKPYWGLNDQAVIVHMHGPKPGDVRGKLQGRSMPPIYETLYAGRPDLPQVYRHYLAIYDRLLDQADAEPEDGIEAS